MELYRFSALSYDGCESSHSATIWPKYFQGSVARYSSNEAAGTWSVAVEMLEPLKASPIGGSSA